MKRLFAVVLAVLVSVSCDGGRAQPKTVWVFFHEGAAASSAPAAIGGFAVAHRKLQGIGTFPNDAPLPPLLIARVEATGAVVRERSRWLRAVSVTADARALRRIRRMPEVASVQPVGSLQRTASAGSLASAMIAPLREDSAFYGPNYTAINQLGIPGVHLVGYDGTGVRIALLDTGFERNHEVLATRAVVAQRDFIHGDNNVANEVTDTTGFFDQERHGTQVWSILGGYLPGQLVGPAYGAQFLLAKIDDEPGDTKVDEDRWVAAVEWADSLGAQIINSSVAFRYRYTNRTPIPYDSLNGDLLVVTRQADEAARRGILIVQAMGEAPTEANGTLSAPADADSVISVGSIDRTGSPAQFNPFFTARGPTFDGRIKPELVTIGTNLVGASSLSGVGLDFNLAGTSYSTALVSGGAALFMQAWPGFTPMAVRRSLQLAGSNAIAPNNTIGWGVPNIGGAILFPDGISLRTVNPISLTGTVTSLAPEFSWTVTQINPRMRPVMYHVEIARDSNFISIVARDSVREGSSVSLKTGLPPSTRLFWRVVATTPVGITRASLRDQFQMPAYVELLTLAGDETTFSNTTLPEFAWLPLTAPVPVGPFSYELQILSHGTGTIVQTVRNLTSSTFKLTEALTPNQSYRWRVIARTRTGQVDTVESTQPFVVATDEKPPATVLYAPFPNPFPRNDLGAFETRVWFDLAAPAVVRLTVNDTRGRLVRRLIPAPGCSPVTLAAGIYGRTGQIGLDEQCVVLRWDGKNDNGDLMPNDVYVLVLQTGNGPVLRKNVVFAPSRN